MAKKVYNAAPATHVANIQTQLMTAVSGPSTLIDEENGPQYDPNPADPNAAITRRGKDVWGEDELENEEY